MTENPYHRNIKTEIKQIVQNSKKYKNIGIEKKIPLPHPTMEQMFHYKPDLVLTTKLGKKYIFEILYDELKDHNLIVSDIIQSYLVENVAKVIFISPFEEGAKLTRKLSSVIGATLQTKGFFKKECPDVFVYTISENETESDIKLRRIMQKFAKQDCWM